MRNYDTPTEFQIHDDENMKKVENVKPTCPFCHCETAEIDIDEEMKGEYVEPWLTCIGGCWIDGVGIPFSMWPNSTKKF